MINHEETFTYNDQPTTCPECGNRTAIISDLSHTSEMTQIHRCLSNLCKNEFIVQKD